MLRVMLGRVITAVVLHQTILLFGMLELPAAPTMNAGSSCALLFLTAIAYLGVRTHCVKREDDSVPSPNIIMELFSLCVLTGSNALAVSYVASYSRTLAYIIFITLGMSLAAYGNYCTSMCFGLGAPATADVWKIHCSGGALSCLLLLSMPNFAWGMPMCGVVGAMLLSTYLCMATNDVLADAVANGGRFRSWRQGAGHVAVLWMQPLEKAMAARRRRVGEF